jgi:hypothetical protein
VLIPMIPSNLPETGVLLIEKEFTPLRGVFLHAAWLRQAFAHCARFLTAASRRSLARVSVPVWLIILSDQLRIVALVGRYPTNQLIRRRPIPERPKTLIPEGCPPRVSCGISHGFPWLSPSRRQVTYVLRTRSPLSPSRRRDHVRLACVKPAASVRPEPGSNSP